MDETDRGNPVFEVREHAVGKRILQPLLHTHVQTISVEPLDLKAEPPHLAVRRPPLYGFQRSSWGDPPSRQCQTNVVVPMLRAKASFRMRLATAGSPVRTRALLQFEPELCTSAFSGCRNS
eukprot:2753299-Rhodomonas_salina.2